MKGIEVLRQISNEATKNCPLDEFLQEIFNKYVLPKEKDLHRFYQFEQEVEYTNSIESVQEKFGLPDLLTEWRRFKIHRIGSNMVSTQTADGTWKRVDTNDEDALDEEQRKFLKEFAHNFKSYMPDGKDNMRAENCLDKADPVRHAKNQLKKITTYDKFYRRLKAFLQHGIKIDALDGTYYENLDSDLFHKWLEKAVSIYSGSETMDEKETKILKIANILSI